MHCILEKYKLAAIHIATQLQTRFLHTRKDTPERASNRCLPCRFATPHESGIGSTILGGGKQTTTEQHSGISVLFLK